MVGDDAVESVRGSAPRGSGCRESSHADGNAVVPRALVGADVNVVPGFSSQFLDFFRIGQFVPTGFGRVEIGHGIDASLAGAFPEQRIRCAHDRRRVHSSAELSENRPRRLYAAANRFANNRPEMVLVFSVSPVTHEPGGLETPVALRANTAGRIPDKARRPHTEDVAIGGKVGW